MPDVYLPGAEKRLQYNVWMSYRPDCAYKVVLHTTETATLPGYAGGSKAPQVTYFANGRIVQDFPLNVPGRALANESGGVETNREGAIQIELVGTCDPSRSGMYFWPDASDEVLLRLWDLCLEPISKLMPVKLYSDVVWVAYPDSYDSPNMPRDRWESYNGVCGHQHVPENVHGDPGNFPWKRMIQLVNARRDAEDDMTREDFVSYFRSAMQDPYVQSKVSEILTDFPNAVGNPAGEATPSTSDDRITVEANLRLTKAKVEDIQAKLDRVLALLEPSTE